MHPLTRRRFLTWSGMAATGAVLGGGSTVGLDQLLGAAGSGGSAPVLVMVTLYGGNDGLNTVIPANDPAYQANREQLAYRPAEVLNLGDGLGLNPGMPRMHALWKAGRMSIVRGAGYPRPDHSHFRSMAIWQTASPQVSIPTGWLGRWLDGTGDDPLTAVSMETTAPPMLAGARRTASMVQTNGLTLPTAANEQAFRMLGVPAPGESTSQARAATAVADMFTVADKVNTALARTPITGRFATQLDAIAALITAGVPTTVYSASLGGFDTHAAERGSQQKLLGELDGALGGFADAVAGAGRPVVTVVYSEFGRRVRANASQGTDHGTAGPMFVIGSNVRAGFLGAQPSLTDLDNGDLKYTVDFRDVYASLLEDVLRTDPETVLGKWPGRMPLTV